MNRHLILSTLLLALLLWGCTDAALPGGTADPASRALDGFAVDLQAGDYWTYFWTLTRSDGARGAGSPATIGGSIRLTLGSPEDMGGINAFPVAISGKAPDDYPGPRWRYLARDGRRLLGSLDGASFEVLFDAGRGAWNGGGFFTRFDPDAPTLTTPATLDNPFLRTSAIAAGQRASEREYYKNGIGPLGYYRFESDASGPPAAAFTEIRIGLVESSLRAADGFRPGIPWAYGADMPAVAFQPVTAVWQDRIYLFGGRDASGLPLSSSLIYDPVAASWSAGPDLPFPLGSDRVDAHRVGDRLYFTRLVEGRMPVYDLAREEWSQGPAIPEQRLGRHCSARIGQRLFFFSIEDAPAGADRGKAPVRVFTLDLETGMLSLDRYRDFPVYARELRGAAAAEGVIYLLGELQAEGETYWSGMLRFDAGSPSTVNPWQQEVIEPVGWSQDIIGDRLFRLDQGELRVLDLRQDRARALSVDKWIQGFEPILPKASRATAVWNGKLFVLGGRSVNGAFVPTVEVYDPAEDWKLL